MSNRASAAVRLLAWAIAIGLFAAVLQSFIAVAVSASIGRVAGLGGTELAQSVLAQSVLSTLLALTTLALAFLAGSSAELPRTTGALGGVIAAVVPLLVLLLGEGPEALGPLELALVRGAGLLACLGAGAAGVELGRRAVRR